MTPAARQRAARLALLRRGLLVATRRAERRAQEVAGRATTAGPQQPGAGDPRRSAGSGG